MLGKIIDLSLTIDPAQEYIQFPRKSLCNAEEPLTSFHICSTVAQTGFLATNVSMTTRVSPTSTCRVTALNTALPIMNSLSIWWWEKPLSLI